ncbi:hypothetical protein Bbelb_193570 [Branchiostoma belcheri]|nr:hypothetical protein Bbelb_193570 [Branchiostoma belcheri]
MFAVLCLAVIFGRSGTEIFRCSAGEPQLDVDPPFNMSGVVPPFGAYSPSGVVEVPDVNIQLNCGYQKADHTGPPQTKPATNRKSSLALSRDGFYNSREDYTRPRPYSHVPLPYGTYAARASLARVGDLVYVNYARTEDFDKLKREGISVEGKIAIARYGKGARGRKLRRAQDRGAVGMIVYSDPKEVVGTGSGPDRMYPDGWYAPGTAVQRGHYLYGVGEGEPLTPGYPATDYVYRIDQSDSDQLPTIPVHVIGYNDAKELLRQPEGYLSVFSRLGHGIVLSAGPGHMGGDLVPSSWKGLLDIDYRFGPEMEGPASKVLTCLRFDVYQTPSSELLIGVLQLAEPAELQSGALRKVSDRHRNVSSKVRLDVNVQTEVRTIHNVVGIIRGREEPGKHVKYLFNQGWEYHLHMQVIGQELCRSTTCLPVPLSQRISAECRGGPARGDRYVILGNHRDAWTFGAVDPNSGTACLLEITRALGEMMRRGWRPRRTLMFVSWDAEEHGMHGSFEWIEEFGKIMSDRAVAYLNVDNAVRDDYTLRARATPSLKPLLKEAAKMVPWPTPDDGDTLYEVWSKRSPETSATDSPPKIDLPAGASDYVPFVKRLGVPILDIAMVHRYTVST